MNKTNKTSKHRTLEELLAVIDVEELKNFRLYHKRRETEEKFNLTSSEFAKIANYCGLFNEKYKQQRERLNSLSRDDYLKLRLTKSNNEICNELHISIDRLFKMEQQ